MLRSVGGLTKGAETMANFTPQEIEEMLREFFDVTGKRQYVGARYVPIFGRKGESSIEWDNSDAYEPLTIVLYQGNSYTSRQYVPTGIDIFNTDFWVQSGNWNAQIEQYRQEVLGFQDQIDDKVPYPINPNSRYGVLGQVLTTLADGKTKWDNPVVVDADIAEPLIDEWLDAHPEATTTVLDNSITDAKLNSSGIKSRVGNYGLLPRPADFNDYTDNNKYFYTAYQAQNPYVNWPDFLPNAAGGVLFVFNSNVGTKYGVQLIIDDSYYTEGDMRSAIRQFSYNSSTQAYTFTPWKPFIKTQRGLATNIVDLNDITYSYSCWLNYNSAHNNIANLPYIVGITIPDTTIFFETICGYRNYNTMQIVYIKALNQLFIRQRYNSVWEDWLPLNDPHTLLNDTTIDLNTITLSGFYTLLAASGDRYPNKPENYTDASLLEVFESKTSINAQKFIVQRLHALTDGKTYQRVYNPTSETWSTWICPYNSLQNSIASLDTRVSTLENDTLIDENIYTLNLPAIFHTIGVVGDSLASGQGRINDYTHYNDFYDFSWPQCMAKDLGNTVYNFTKSGLNTRTWLTDQNGWALANDGNHNAVCYIIGLGANDIALGVDYIGTIADVHPNNYQLNADTYYGNYGRIISMLRTIEPRSYIFVVTNPVYGSDAEIRNALNTAVRAMPTLFDRVYLIDPVVDDYTGNSFIHRNLVAGHYTPAAYKYMSNMMIKQMGDIIYNNPEDFYWVNLVGTEYNDPS